METGKDKKQSRARRIINTIRPQKNQPKKKLSYARATRLPQISHDGLSHSGEILLLLIQHAIDEQQISVPDTSIDWDQLVVHNPEFLVFKKRTKDICNISRMSSYDLQTIATRTSKFIKQHQPHMLIKS